MAVVTPVKFRGLREHGRHEVTPESTPRFTPAEAARIAAEVFGVVARSSGLPSERDQNFLLDAVEGGRFVLKIAKADEQQSVLEFQNAALEQVALRAPALAVPRVCQSRSGESMTRVADQRGQFHYV